MIENSSNEKRDYLFDNYKTLLIILIVVGHFLDLSYKHNTFSYYFKWVVYAFHIPAFVFISGYFSKKRAKIKDLITKLLVPYLVFEVVYYLYYTYVLEANTELYLLYPKFTLWYLLCLFAWRLIPIPKKKQYLFVGIAIVLGLLIGFSDMKNNFLSIPRMLVFLPFFLAGRWMTKEKIEKLRSKWGRAICLAGFAASIFAVIITAGKHELTTKIFYGRYNYDFLGEGAAEGMVIRISCYLIAFVMLTALLGIISAKKNLLSYIGRRTLPIYIIHGFIFKYFMVRTEILQNINTPTETIVLIGLALLLVLFLSLPFFNNIMSYIAGGYLKRKQQAR